MPDLTADTCPTCGLPAEVLERNDTEAIARCILLHDFTIPIKTVTLNAPEPAPAAQVIPFRAPKVSARPGVRTGVPSGGGVEASEPEGRARPSAAGASSRAKRAN